MSSNLRRILALFLFLAVIAILIYRYRHAIAWNDLADSVRHARWELLLLSLVAIYAGYGLRALRWRRFCRYLGTPGFPGIYRATLMGFASIFLLGRAGEPIRPLLIARRENLPVSGMFGIYILERIWDTITPLAFAGLALRLIPHTFFGAAENNSTLNAIRTAGTTLFIIVVLFILFLIYFRLHGASYLERKAAEWQHHTGLRARLSGLFSGFSLGLGAIRTLADLGMAAFYSAAHWLLVALIYFWVARSFGGRLAELDYSAALIVLAFTMVGSVVQLPAVGGGSQAASFLAFTLLFGVQKEPAAAASIVLWLITFTACSLVGIPLLIREGMSFGELSRMAKAESDAEAHGTHVTATRGEGNSP